MVFGEDGNKEPCVDIRVDWCVPVVCQELVNGRKRGVAKDVEEARLGILYYTITHNLRMIPGGKHKNICWCIIVKYKMILVI